MFNGSFCSAGCNYHTHSVSQIKKRRRVTLRGDPVKHCIHNTVQKFRTQIRLQANHIVSFVCKLWTLLSVSVFYLCPLLVMIIVALPLLILLSVSDPLCSYCCIYKKYNSLGAKCKTRYEKTFLIAALETIAFESVTEFTIIFIYTHFK